MEFAKLIQSNQQSLRPYGSYTSGCRLEISPVESMACDGCEQTVVTALENVAGVKAREC